MTSEKAEFPDIVYGVGLHGDFTVYGFSQNFIHLKRSDGASRSFGKGEWAGRVKSGDTFTIGTHMTIQLKNPRDIIQLVQMCQQWRDGNLITSAVVSGTDQNGDPISITFIPSVPSGS